MYDSITDSIHHLGFKRLLLAVSGGLDSICLAHYFICNKAALGIEWLGIAHVHHGLRVGTADRDAAFVEAFARKYNVLFFLKKLDGEALKAASGSLEENARDARYKALEEIFNETEDPRLRGDDNKDVIVTAHHAGDQAETMYMRLRRGTTLAGLRGIQEFRILSNASPTPRIINHPSFHTPHSTLHIPHLIYRPFLSVTRQELLAYARENSLEWVEDESNADVNFARNRIRHEMLPRLERECPGATAQLCRIAALADRAYGKVMEACEGLFGTCLREDDIPHVSITLDKKKLRKVLLAHKNTDLSEMFRLWLSEKGLRFPIGFFYDPKEPACVKIPHHAVYRRRAIVKIGQSVRICEFDSPEEAEIFVSCGKKNKGL